jgi:hypothetical protein
MPVFDRMCPITARHRKSSMQKLTFSAQDLHRAANGLLNEETQRSNFSKGRVKINYAHPRETDSFETLSTVGLQALPLALQQRREPGRELRLRTSRDSNTGAVKARIVKVKIADIHIFNPRGQYDCRISINVEVNMNRPDLHPDDLVVRNGKLRQPERKKDRLSYKHLAYSIDLTRVDVEGMQPKFELELEVDGGVLREQMQAVREQRDEGGFGAVVGGFLDNAVLLMRLQPPPAQQS